MQFPAQDGNSLFSPLGSSLQTEKYREIVKRLEILHNTFPRILKDTAWLTKEYEPRQKAGGHFSRI